MSDIASPSGISFEFPDCVNCGARRSEHITFAKTKVMLSSSLKADVDVVICSVCGLVFLSPRPTKDFLHKFYAREYFTEFPEKLIELLRVQYTQLHGWLSELIPDLNKMRLLDVGSGAGVWLSLFDNKDKVGVEISERAVRFSKERFNLHVLHVDFLENSFEDEEFDIITALGLLEHVYDPLVLLCEMNRVLRAGGYLYVVTPDVLEPSFRFGLEGYFKIVHLYYFSPGTLSSLLEKAGFEMISIRERPSSAGRVAEIDALARKVARRGYEEAKGYRFHGEDPALVIRKLKAAMRRDIRYIYFMRAKKAIYELKLLRLTLGVLRPLYRPIIRRYFK